MERRLTTNSRAVAPYQSNETTSKRTSSVYSEPEPKIPEHIPEEPPQRGASLSNEVSPLSTAQSSFDSLPISPIASPTHPPSDLNAETTPTQKEFKSQIPRRKVPDSTSASVKSEQHSDQVTSEEKQATKWDDYSGEPSENGKPSTVRPGGQPLEHQFPQLKERTRQILADLRERNAGKSEPKPKTAPAADPLDQPMYKEPWKGASGRTTLVEPVQNTPAARLKPLRIPERNIGRQHSVAKSAPLTELPAEPVSAPPSGSKATPLSELPAEPASAPFSKTMSAPLTELPAEPVSTPVSAPAEKIPLTIRSVRSDDNIKPVAPLKIGNKTFGVLSPPAGETTSQLQSPFQSPQIGFDQRSPDQAHTPTIPRKTIGPVEIGSSETSAPTYRSAVQPTRQDRPVEKQSTPILHNQEPKSRFSWTTYTTTVDDSPRSIMNWDDSPAPPSSPPVMLRKRPVAKTNSPAPFSNPDGSVSNTSLVSRKAVAAERHRSVSALISASMSKTLPQCPPEMEASDKITTLEARLDDLSRRKGNLHKIIRELNASLQKNLIVYDHRKRKEIEKMVINLNLELAEITQEEHEVGIQLHRAQRKRDREDNYEQPTGLWIKRVTS